jgi:hypothetical protein
VRKYPPIVMGGYVIVLEQMKIIKNAKCKMKDLTLGSFY